MATVAGIGVPAVALWASRDSVNPVHRAPNVQTCYNKSMSLRILLFIALFSPVSVQACSLNLGWQPWGYYFYEEKDGTVAGLEVDILGEALKRAGCEMTLSNVLWKRLLKSSRNGAFDLVYSAAFRPDRAEWGHYSTSYREESTRVYVRRSHPLPDVKRLDDLAAYSIAGLNEMYYANPVDDFVAKHGDHMEFGFDSTRLVKLLASGRVDAVFGDHRALPHAARQLGLSEIIEHPLTLPTVPVHAVFSRATVNRDIVDRFDAALASMRADGTLQQMIDRYEKEPPNTGAH